MVENRFKTKGGNSCTKNLYIKHIDIIFNEHEFLTGFSAA